MKKALLVPLALGLAGCGGSNDERLARAQVADAVRVFSRQAVVRVLDAEHVGRTTWRVVVQVKGKRGCYLVDVAKFEAHTGGGGSFDGLTAYEC